MNFTAKIKPSLVIPPVEVRCSPIHGYGIFASKKIKAGDIIEECPILICDNHDYWLTDYAFQWCDAEGKIVDDIAVIALGYGCLYNCAPSPNAEYQIEREHGLMTVVAKYDIQPGEEIFIHYGNDWLKKRNLEFIHTPPAITTISQSNSLIKSKALLQLTKAIAVIIVIIFIKIFLAP